MRFSYKLLVERFAIPRPTLIEWQKRAKADKKNWRVKHLEYLRHQIELENLTKAEIKSKPLNIEDIFLISVYLFFNKNINYIDVNILKKGLREFAYMNRSSVEYKHDFAKKIWSVSIQDGTQRQISNYHRTFDILDSFTAFQYGLFIQNVIEFIDKIEEKISPSKTDLLDGLSWQELHMYDKYFSNKAIEKFFSQKGLI
ncbi:MAG TPA: hypothetical protein CFH79_07835 [Sulfurospirillum sp. UBA11407]|nr:MAG TPA: hypothetical protein CFH79_07835 [Sulfurospirillum sp. UBA11407]